MYHVLWEYEVLPDRVAAFEALYGATGAWSRLFRGADGYLGTELYRDAAEPAHYLTLDRWTSPAAYETFLRRSREAYAHLDQQADELTVRERRLGTFEGQ